MKLKLRSTIPAPDELRNHPKYKRGKVSDTWQIERELDEETAPEEAAADISGPVSEKVKKILRAEEELRKESPFIVEHFTSEEMDGGVTGVIANSFREIFCNTSEYAVCQHCDKLVGAAQVYGLAEDTYLPVELLDMSRQLPDCSSCERPMELLYDPLATFKNLKRKFSRDAYVTLLRTHKGDIGGFTFGYMRSFKEVYDLEWRSKYIYTKQPHPNSLTDYDTVIDRVTPLLSEEIGAPVDGNTDIFCWNCVAIGPKLRGSGAARTMLREFILQLPPGLVEKKAVLGETKRGSKFYSILRSSGLYPMEVGADDYVLIGGALKNMHRRWVNDKAEKVA